MKTGGARLPKTPKNKEGFLENCSRGVDKTKKGPALFVPKVFRFFLKFPLANADIYSIMEDVQQPS